MAGKERDQLLGHADEADGIEEYDNPLPAWWLGLFYFTLAWGVIYAVHYHFIAHRSQAKAYEAEVAAALQRWPQPEKVEVAEVANDASAIAEGEKVFQSTCAPCHGADLTGGIGPNLVDSEWIHGGSLEEVVQTITNGVPEKGMPAWGPVLGPEKVAQVAAYIKSKGQ